MSDDQKVTLSAIRGLAEPGKSVLEQITEEMRERVIGRLYLIGDIVEPKKRAGDYDRELDAVIADTVTLVDSLVSALRHGTAPAHKSQLLDGELAARCFARIAGCDPGGSAEFLAREFRGWGESA